MPHESLHPHRARVSTGCLTRRASDIGIFDQFKRHYIVIAAFHPSQMRLWTTQV